MEFTRQEKDPSAPRMSTVLTATGTTVPNDLLARHDVLRNTVYSTGQSAGFDQIMSTVWYNTVQCTVYSIELVHSCTGRLYSHSDRRGRWRRAASSIPATVPHRPVLGDCAYCTVVCCVITSCYRMYCAQYVLYCTAYRTVPGG
jgi:hypothetical protein